VFVDPGIFEWLEFLFCIMQSKSGYPVGLLCVICFSSVYLRRQHRKNGLKTDWSYAGMRSACEFIC